MTVPTHAARRFWMVWNPHGRAPTYKHFSRADAEKEAERLAHNNPSQSFYVLKAVGGTFGDVMLKPIELSKSTDADPMEEELPF